MGTLGIAIISGDILWDSATLAELRSPRSLGRSPLGPPGPSVASAGIWETVRQPWKYDQVSWLVARLRTEKAGLWYAFRTAGR